MERRSATRIAQVIAGLGLAAAVAIYFLAAPVDENPLGYDPLTNKKYVHELQRYGGKANVATAEFMQWFESLWHGRTLGYTVAVLSVGVAWVFWWFATLPPLERRPQPPANPNA